jgi:TonB family protein
MSNSPSLRRPPSGLPAPHVLLPMQATVHTVFSPANNDSDAIIDTLRGALASGASELNPILTAIAEAAQTLTGASGSALALRTDGAVVCRARAGETAPEVGAQLSENSGISGECLRSGKILRCDDTQKDYRVNPAVCRSMGLHSMALVPIRARQQVAGVLEVFSTRAYAFGEPEMTLLRRVAELAEAAYLQELSERTKDEPESAPVSEIKPAASWSHPNEDALRRLGSQVTIEELRIGRSNVYRFAIPGAILVILFSVLGWKIFSKPKAHRASVVAAAGVNPAAEAAETGTVITLGGVSTRRARTRSAASAVSGVSVVRKPRHQRNEDEEDPHVSDVVKRTSATETTSQPAAVQTPEPVANAAAPPKETEAAKQEASQKTEVAPELQTVSEAKPAALGSLFASPIAKPKFDPPISGGVTGGSVEHKVQPTYPREALVQHLEGPVVLHATISEQGKVQAIKTVSGNPVLARAAMDAVRQWRYHPYELNGKPVATDTQIMVNFKAPGN